MNKKVILIVVLAVVGLAGLMLYSILGNIQYRVEVCVAYNGHTSCRTARADTRDHAVRSAQTNACALIASGVTDTMRCESSVPTSVVFLEKK